MHDHMNVKKNLPSLSAYSSMTRKCQASQSQISQKRPQILSITMRQNVFTYGTKGKQECTLKNTWIRVPVS